MAEEKINTGKQVKKRYFHRKTRPAINDNTTIIDFPLTQTEKDEDKRQIFPQEKVPKDKENPDFCEGKGAGALLIYKPHRQRKVACFSVAIRAAGQAVATCPKNTRENNLFRQACVSSPSDAPHRGRTAQNKRRKRMRKIKINT